MKCEMCQRIVTQDEADRAAQYDRTAGHGTLCIECSASVATSTKHTPGPWKLDFFSRTIQTEDERNVAKVCDVTWRDQIRKRGQDGSDANYEEIANARLIAAAPALLEALKRLAFLYPWAHDNGPDDELREQVNSTIRAAEGE